jgi:ABC-2 type transport system ATP-binding protein
VQDFVREVQRDHAATILLTTHDMHEAEALCDRIAFIVAGSIVAEGTSLELRSSIANGRGVADIDLEDVFMELTGKSVEDDEEEVTVDG